MQQNSQSAEKGEQFPVGAMHSRLKMPINKGEGRAATEVAATRPVRIRRRENMVVCCYLRDESTARAVLFRIEMFECSR